MKKIFLPTILLASCIEVACTHAPTKTPQANAMTSANAMQGYLAPDAVPSSLSLVPAPPAPGSAAMARDEEINRSALTMHGTPRWDMAIHDAVLTFPAVAQTFACVVNAPISEERTPKLIALLKHTLTDAGRATAEAKQNYRRPRPFISNGKPVCTPEREDALRRDGSYPSGHASIGWAFGLVLAEVSPQEANAIFARARAFGQSRLVCNVHWQSDVQEGQVVGSAVVARLHAEAAFRNDVAAAREEIAALHAQHASVGRDCAQEAQALQNWR